MRWFITLRFFGATDSVDKHYSGSSEFSIRQQIFEGRDSHPSSSALWYRSILQHERKFIKGDLMLNVTGLSSLWATYWWKRKQHSSQVTKKNQPTRILPYTSFQTVYSSRVSTSKNHNWRGAILTNNRLWAPWSAKEIIQSERAKVVIASFRWGTWLGNLP